MAEQSKVEVKHLDLDIDPDLLSAPNSFISTTTILFYSACSAGISSVLSTSSYSNFEKSFVITLFSRPWLPNRDRFNASFPL